MSDNNKYSVLFVPVKAVQSRPRTASTKSLIAAGWGVVSTEETGIHPTSDLSPYTEQQLWDERDIPALRLMTEVVHAEGALAAFWPNIWPQQAIR